MADTISINIDTSGIDAVVEHLRHIKGGAETAIKNAMNTAVSGIKADAGREVSRAFVIDAETVKKRMWTARATTTKLSAEVGRRGRQFTAARFPFDPNTMPGVRGGRAVFVRPRRDGGGTLLDAEGRRSKAFAVNGRVFRRMGASRKPIDFARVISVPEMLGDADVRRVVEANASRRFNEELDRQVALLLKSGEGVEA